MNETQLWIVAAWGGEFNEDKQKAREEQGMEAEDRRPYMMSFVQLSSSLNALYLIVLLQDREVEPQFILPTLQFKTDCVGPCCTISNCPCSFSWATQLQQVNPL